MKFTIKYRGPKEKIETKFEKTCSYAEAKAEYQRLQDLLPSHRLGCYATNDYGETVKLADGRWK